MIFETLALLAIVLGAVACLTMAGVRAWLRQQATTRYGKLIKSTLANGQVKVVAIGLTKKGKETGRRTWRAKSLDQELLSTFGRKQRVRITV